MTDIKAKYGSSTALTMTSLTSLPSSTSYGGGCCVAVDNSTNVFLDALVLVKVRTSASALANDKAFYVYAYASVDGGSTFTDGVTGTDTTVVLTSPPNAPLLGVINAPSTSTTYRGGPWSVASAFGGALPQYWGIVVVNVTGQTTSGTGSDHSAVYQGVYAQAS